MLVAPTEPLQLRNLGRVSSLPEKYGADFLIPSTSGLIGIQRKEVKDWVASYFDGRLAREIPQAKALDRPILLLEGSLRFTDDGLLIAKWNGGFSKSQHLSLLLSMMAQGWWVLSSTSISDTADLLTSLQKWLSKDKHQELGRPKAQRSWGNSGNRDWGIHLLQGFDNIGTGVAGAIYDHFQGVPLSWSCSEVDLMEVKGVGKGRARKLIEALKAREANPEEITTLPDE